MMKGFLKCKRIVFGFITVFLFSHCSIAGAQTDFTGVWSGFFDNQEHTYWNAEDSVCFPGCPKILHDQLARLLSDPSNADTPSDAIIGEVFGIMISDRMARSTTEGKRRINESMSQETFDMSKLCERLSLLGVATNPLPIKISSQGTYLQIDYEHRNVRRVIYMDGRKAPNELELSTLGFSSGEIQENGMLVVNTVGLSESIIFSIHAPNNEFGSYADGSDIIERYEVKENPRRLELELSLTDAITLTEPYIFTKTWLYTPEMEMYADTCEDVSGVADY